MIRFGKRVKHLPNMYLSFLKLKKYFILNGFYRAAIKAYKVIARKIKLISFYRVYAATEEELSKQQKQIFENNPLVSIIVPLYNTPGNFLNDMLSSVASQSYTKWQLCLADGSDEGNDAKDIIDLFIEKNPGKVRYIKLSVNKGISENTNECIKLAGGDYIALLDHDDILAPDALFEAVKVINENRADFIYTDEAMFSQKIERIQEVHFKPDFAIDNLRSNNYICHLAVFKTSLLEKTGLFRKEYDGSQDHDIILRLTEVACNIVHIPKVLYYWRMHNKSTAENVYIKPYVAESGIKAVSDHLSRQGIRANVTSSEWFPTIYRIRYDLLYTPLISIIIINDNGSKKLMDCLDSIVKKSTYSEYEIVIVDVGLKDNEAKSTYEEIEKRYNVQVVYWNSSISNKHVLNFSGQHAKGEFLVFLHSDTSVISGNWMEEMLMYAQRPDVGAIGAKLYNKDNSVQHAGICIRNNKKEVIGYPGRGEARNSGGYMGRLFYAQDISAVTIACLMVKKEIFNYMGGFDDRFTTDYAAADLCLRMRTAGYTVVFTPYAEFYHYKKTDKNVGDGNKERLLFKQRWQSVIEKRESYYSSTLNHFYDLC